MLSLVAILYVLITINSVHCGNICLEAHNKLRALHKDTEPLQWDVELAKSAQQWANHLLRIGRMEHSTNRKGQGENLAYYRKWGKAVKKASCARALHDWYMEFEGYNFYTATRTPTSKTTVKHFTQVVWKRTTHVGVGIASRKTKLPNGFTEVTTYIVARYYPAGNVNGQFIDNVAFRKSTAKTPSVGELDPSTIPPCKNVHSIPQCQWYATSSYGPCDGYYKQYFQNNCRKYCKFCS